MKIVVLDGKTLGAGDNPWTPLDNLGSVEIYDRSSEPETQERAPRAEILVVNKTLVSATTIERCPSLRFIAVTATGYDCVDVAAARRYGIPVANVPEYGTNAVAQFTIALLLELCHRIGLHADAVRAGDWSKSPDFCFWRTPQVELTGKTLGVIGFGRIGRRVGELAHAFGMNVLAHSRTQQEAPAHFRFRGAGLSELLSEADVISLHCPLNPATAGMINSERLRHVKSTAFLINTSRGGLIVDDDVALALNEGRLAGAALDVVNGEPIQGGHSLLKAKNCLLTPHIAWASREARRRLLAITVENIANFLSGTPSNVVN